MDAVEHVLPKAEHRYCAMHLYANWGKKNNNKELQNQFVQSQTTCLTLKQT